ncbi:MAG: NADP-dependent malic enzyme [Candidatus Moranbacteria bacterium]|nr:NADP-dependent malic enzyme [Candidatus Moranbacteria bacterium]
MKKKVVRKSTGAEAIALHKKLKGKIAISSKMKVSLETLSLLYTPGVAKVSTLLSEHPEKTNQYTWRGNTVAVVSDGSAVLGLGNIGSEGALPVMEGKAMLFQALSGIDAVPIVLATQDTEEIIATVKNLAPSFAGVNLEDISAPRCFEIEERLKEMLDIPVMHDDQHGTAMVVLAGLINALKVVKKKPKDCIVVVAGAGAAGQAIVDQLIRFGMGEIIVVDSKGIIHHDRPDLDKYKKDIADRTNQSRISGSIEDAMQGADVFIGVSKGDTVTVDMVASMAIDPIVFALANPHPEILPEDAKRGGAAVVATGRSDFENQLNNALGFPGIFRGALDHGVKEITDDMLFSGAKALAKLVAKPTAQMIIPSVFDIRVAKAVARAIK